MPDERPSGEYTRFQVSIQKGPAKNRRKTTVETVRKADPDRETRTVPFPIDGEKIEEIEAPVNSKAFAEFYFELTRAVAAVDEVFGE